MNVGDIWQTIENAAKEGYQSLKNAAPYMDPFNIMRVVAQDRYGGKQSAGTPQTAVNPAPVPPPEVEVTETTDADGKKKVTKKIKASPAGNVQSAPQAQPGPSVGLTALQSALGSISQKPDVKLPGTIDFSSLKIPDSVPRAYMDEQARRTYAPFLPTEKDKGFQRILMGMAHVLTETEQNRQAYHQALDQNYRANRQMEMLKEQQKRQKMYGELAEQQTLASMQRYERSLEASRRLSDYVHRYKDLVFTDPEVNAGARMLAAVAGTPGAIPPLARQKPVKLSKYEHYRQAKLRENPKLSETEIQRQYTKDTSVSHGEEEDLRKMLLPKDAVNMQLARGSVKSFLTGLTDPGYVQHLTDKGVDVHGLLKDVLVMQWPAVVEWAEQYAKESGIPVQDVLDALRK